MNEKEEKPRIFIQVSLSEEEKELIMEIAKKEHTNASNIMRIATFDYIRKLENPEVFSGSTINLAILEQIIKNTKKTLELEELILEKQNILEEMNKTLALIKNFTLKPDLETKTTILNLFKAHTSLNPKEIMDQTNFDQELVFSVIAELQNENLIEMTSRGRFKIK